MSTVDVSTTYLSYNVVKQSAKAAISKDIFNEIARAPQTDDSISDKLATVRFAN